MKTDKKAKNSDQIEFDYRIPSGDYQDSVEKHLLRLSAVEVRENEVTFRRQYNIGGMRYTVRSIFPMSDRPTAEDHLKRLMANEIERAS